MMKIEHIFKHSHFDALVLVLGPTPFQIQTQLHQIIGAQLHIICLQCKPCVYGGTESYYKSTQTSSQGAVGLS